MRKLFYIALIILSSNICHSQWQMLDSNTEQILSKVFFIDPLTGWACGGFGTILSTTDGGENWRKDSLNVPYNDITDIEFININTGFVLTDTRIWKTTNGGTNFYQFHTGTLWLDEIDFINENTGYVIGFQTWFKTTNQGQNWIQHPCAFACFDELRSIEVIDTGLIYMGSHTSSNHSYYYKIRNGGWNSSDWTRYTNYPVPLGWLTASFLNADSGFFGNSSQGLLIRTTNRGNNWHIAELFGGNISEVDVVDNRIVYLVSSWDYISKSYDFGLNWIQQPYPNDTNRLRSIFMLDENTGYAVGEHGLILKTTNGGGTVGIDPISNNIPGKFTLYQNFPNPFNPHTSIKFDLPKAGHTTLLVYSITGEIISELVSEHLRAGEYSINFNASHLPSGVYFYKLETGDYSKVNKMVLIK